MAETDVESVFRQIRERVITEQRLASTDSPALPGSAGNGKSESEEPAISRSTSEAISEGNLTLISSYLTTTARSWDRLPPLVSNRSGSSARLELWLKRQLKRATRWFTWEQVNFNAAVHHALRDMQPVLSAQAQEFANLRAQIERLVESQQVANEQQRAGLSALGAELSAQSADLSAQRSNLSAQRVEFETQRRTMEEQRSRVLELVNEFRERLAAVQEEQRVSFKQVTLESSEAAQLEDRARRKTESLLLELQHRIEQLESKGA